MDKTIFFEDNKIVNYDYDNQELISIRDGYQEYLGIEIGEMPQDKVFKIYRDPNTIKNVAERLVGLPVTDEHIDTDIEVTPDLQKGTVVDSKVVELIDASHDATIGVHNEVRLKENMLQLVRDGKNELSLGYRAKLIPHSFYDFQQVEIEPHHLAIVHSGRCGEVCKFNDNNGANMDVFLDENGTVSLEKVIGIANQLPEAISKMDLDTVKKLIPILQKALEAAGMNTEVEAEAEPEVEPMEDMETEPAMEDEEMGEEVDKDKIEKEAVEGFKDSAEFKDALHVYAEERVEVIEKAKPFLDAKYEFKGKNNLEIMADALKAEGHEFKDEEIKVAFKMLKSEPVADYKEFGDEQKECHWSKISETEVK